MNRYAATALTALALIAAPLWAQDEDASVENIVVTAQRRENSLSGPISVGGFADRRPVIGLKRTADSVVRTITITSDSREEDMRKREVETMLLAALEMADREGLSLVTGVYEVTVVTKANWRDLFPGLVGKTDTDDDVDDDDDNSKVAPGFEDDGSEAKLTLKVKTKLTGSIAEAQGGITRFVKKVPKNGRAQMAQKGELALTIINPEQYRDEIYRRIAAGTKHAAEFYGTDYGAEITGLDREIKWEQASSSEVFLFIPYSFTVRK